jgi:hypothetical protein
VRQATISSRLAEYPIRAIEQIPSLGVLRLSVSKGAEIAISQQLSEDPTVEYAEPDYLVRALRTEGQRADR